jgi:peptidyl-prolyl cis-trans isomerase B (cyclophilin B)
MIASTAAALFAALFSVLVPQKMWFTPYEPLTVNVKSDKDVTLELIDFTGKVIAAKSSADVTAGQSADLKTAFPDTAKPGTFVLFALAKGTAPSQSGPPKEFLGTPLVIEVISQPAGDPSAPPSAMVTHVLPLQYAVMTTESGPLTEAFYYDVAPHTVDNFLTLSEGGFYDGLVFHRVAPGFVIQGGDPLGADSDPQKRGMGSPGFNVGAEFNDRPHAEGVLSMARSSDPNSAGSQFFICLDYSHTQQLDHQYTAFGKVTEGMDVVTNIAGAKVNGETPEHAVVIKSVEVFGVTAQKDPYTTIIPTK